MPLKDVYLVSRKLDLVPAQEIDELEKTLGFPLPVGYREYLTTLGKGQFCNTVDVLTPTQVLDPEERQYWIKDLAPYILEQESYRGQVLLTQDELNDAYIFATSEEGDKFIACPQKAGQLFELPRHENKMHHYPDGFLEPFQLGVLKKSYLLPYFRPESSRTADTTLYARTEMQVQEIWAAVKALSRAPLVVAAQREAGSYEEVYAFIPDIQGSVLFGKNAFEIVAESEFAPALRQLSQKFKDLTERPDRPDDE